MSIGTAICWTAWFFVISNIDPVASGYLGLVFFYISLFLALTGTFSVIGFLIRRRILKKDEIVFHHVRHTFRQGILLSILVLTGLIMLQQKLLTLGNGILLVVIFLILESIIFTGRKYRNRDFI